MFSILARRKNRSKCLVHCKMGVSRSASTVIAYAMKEFGWSLEKAYNFVKQKRSITRPNPGFMRQLAEYEGILDARYSPVCVCTVLFCSCIISLDLFFLTSAYSICIFPVNSVTTSCGIQMQTVRWRRGSIPCLSAVEGRREATSLQSRGCLPAVRRRCLIRGLRVPPHAGLFHLISTPPTTIIISADSLTRRWTANHQRLCAALPLLAWKRSL